MVIRRIEVANEVCVQISQYISTTVKPTIVLMFGLHYFQDSL